MRLASGISWLGKKADAGRIRPLAESLIEVVKEIVRVFDSD